jgi:hypothetical protein
MTEINRAAGAVLGEVKDMMKIELLEERLAPYVLVHSMEMYQAHIFGRIAGTVANVLPKCIEIVT